MCGKSPLTRIINSLNILTIEDIIRLTELNALKMSDLLCPDDSQISSIIQYIKLNESFFKQMIQQNIDVKKNKPLKRSRSNDHLSKNNCSDVHDFEYDSDIPELESDSDVPDLVPAV